MNFIDLNLAEQTMETSVREACKEARRHELQRQAKLAQPRGPGRHGRKLLGQLALLLVACGARLVDYGLPPRHPSQAETGASGRSRSPA